MPRAEAPIKGLSRDTARGGHSPRNQTVGVLWFVVFFLNLYFSTCCQNTTARHRPRSVLSEALSCPPPGAFWISAGLTGAAGLGPRSSNPPVRRSRSLPLRRGLTRSDRGWGLGCSDTPETPQAGLGGAPDPGRAPRPLLVLAGGLARRRWLWGLVLLRTDIHEAGLTAQRHRGVTVGPLQR